MPAEIYFGVIGLDHNHIYDQVNLLQEAGAVLSCYYSKEPAQCAAFAKAYPEARQASTPAEILENNSLQLITSAAIPNERSAIGIAAMNHGKDFLSDKPGFTTLEGLAEARRVQELTGRFYWIHYSDRLGNAATIKAAGLVKSGAIGKVVQTNGWGPHRANLTFRPSWFFRREQYGGILADLSTHQIDQFLFFSGASTAEVVGSRVANYKNPQYPELEDFGEILLRSEQASGFIRVDWYTPDGLPVWGDTRLMILGTEGYIEIRKNIDIAGRNGGNHLLLVDREKVHYFDCQHETLPFGSQLVEDIKQRSQTALNQKHSFMVAELALKAQSQAVRSGNLLL